MLERRQIQRVVDLALDEDAPHGDLTSEVFVPADATATADLVMTGRIAEVAGQVGPHRLQHLTAHR